jgi:membrane associated rhomboid family serine protease
VRAETGFSTDMDLPPNTIPARSRLEAMDWSLVLISQGIESTIVPPAEGSGWHLVVPSQDIRAASHAIQLYRAENRAWRLRREIFEPGLLFDWLSLVWVALVCSFYFLNAFRPDLKTAGEVDTAAVSYGQWWRLFTAIWLHADLAHLASNAVFGVVLLGLAMGRYGPGVGVLLAYLAGVLGNGLSFACELQAHYGLGASGMVMGCLGLLAAQSIRLWRTAGYGARHSLKSMVGGLLLFLLIGVTPGTDVVAHFGGFAAGTALGIAAIPLSRLSRTASANLLCALLFAGLIAWPWLLAMRHGH